MGFLERFRKAKEPGAMSEDRAIEFLKARGYWEPLPGTKGAGNPKLHFPYADAIAFAIDSDPKFSDDNRPVHVINSEQDYEMYRDPALLDKALATGYCSQRLKGRRFVVVPRGRG